MDLTFITLLPACCFSSAAVYSPSFCKTLESPHPLKSSFTVTGIEDLISLHSQWLEESFHVNRRSSMVVVTDPRGSLQPPLNKSKRGPSTPYAAQDHRQKLHRSQIKAPMVRSSSPGDLMFISGVCVTQKMLKDPVIILHFLFVLSYVLFGPNCTFISCQNHSCKTWGGRTNSLLISTQS